MGTRWLLVIALGACGRVNFDEALGPFSPPTRIDELSTAPHQSDPALTGDELEIYFDSDRAGGKGSDDIWRATRPTRTSPWSDPTPVAELNTVDSDVSPGLTPDGLTIYTTRSLIGSGNGYDIWISTRPDRSSAWTTPVRVDELSSMDEDTNAQIGANGLSFWLSSTRNAATARQLWLATRATTTSAWNAPLAVDALDIAPDVYTSDASPNANDTRIYFVTDRETGGRKQLWIVDRPTPTTFGQPHPIEELASPNPDADPWISLDEKRLYFSKVESGRTELFVAERP